MAERVHDPSLTHAVWLVCDWEDDLGAGIDCPLGHASGSATNRLMRTDVPPSVSGLVFPTCVASSTTPKSASPMAS
jgi:hypothetical protein